MEHALEAGAEDVKSEDGEYEVITDPASFEVVKKALDDKGSQTSGSADQYDSFQYG